MTGTRSDRLLLALCSLRPLGNLSDPLLTSLVANSPDAPVAKLADVRPFLCLFRLFLFSLFLCFLLFLLLFLCRSCLGVLALSREKLLLWASSVACLRNKLQNFLPHPADLALRPRFLFGFLESAGNFLVFFFFLFAIPSESSSWSTAFAAGFCLYFVMASDELCQLVTVGPVAFLVLAKKPRLPLVPHHHLIPKIFYNFNMVVFKGLQRWRERK